MPRRVSHPIDVPMCTGLSQPVLRLGDTRALHTEHDGVIGSPQMWEELRYAGALWPPPGGPLNAPGRLARRAPAATLAPEDVRCPARLNAESFGTGFHRHPPEHQMGDGYHLH